MRRGVVAWFGAGAVALLGGAVTSSLGPATKLGEFHCYRSLDTLEHACRAFDQAGFRMAAGSSGVDPSAPPASSGSPSRSPPTPADS